MIKEFTTSIMDDEDIEIFLIEGTIMDYRVEMVVNEVTEWIEDKPSKYEQYLKATVKWDGCSHIFFGDDDGYIHLCGRRCYDHHKIVIDTIFTLAEELLPNFDKETANA